MSFVLAFIVAMIAITSGLVSGQVNKAPAAAVASKSNGFLPGPGGAVGAVGTILANLQARNVIPVPTIDPCSTVNCGPEAMCVSGNIGVSSVQNYDCVPKHAMVGGVVGGAVGGVVGGVGLVGNPGVVGGIGFPQEGGFAGMTAAVLPLVPKCFDEVIIRYPATRDAALGLGGVGSPFCATQCITSANCGPKQICCMRGCDRICYLPKKDLVDYTG